jgi:VWFA-related protein
MALKSRSSGILFFLCSKALVLVLAVSCWSALSAAYAQSDRAFKMRVEVELTTFEVVALDKKGNPVRNLKKEDFQLYEDGKKQEIYGVDEVIAESAVSPLGANPFDESALHRGKTVLLVFDDTSINPQYIQASRDSARRFVSEHMRSQDVFAVAAYGMSLQIYQNFTGNREEVLQAIEKPAAANAGGGVIYFENLLRSFEQINPSLAKIKGQKSVIVFSQSSVSQSSSMPFSPSLRSPGNVSGTLSYTYNNLLESVKKANVVFYMVDPGALIGSNSNSGLSVRSLASESGGFSILDTNDIDHELGKLDQQISNYYVLTFQSNNPRHEGAYRKLDVRTELKGVTFRHREGYQDRRPVDVLASSRQEKALLKALESSDRATQLPILFRPLYFYDTPRSAKVLLATRIGMEKVKFQKIGKQLGTDLNIMGIAYAENNSMAARFSETLPIRFDREKESEIRKGNLGYRNYFRLRPGKYRLKLAVLDASNNLGSVEQLLEVPSFPDQGFAGSSLIAAERASQLPNLIENLQTQLLDENDPLLYSGTQIEPSVSNRFSASSRILLMFRLYHLPGSSDQTELTAKATLRDEKGKEYAQEPVSLKTAISPVNQTEAVVGLAMSFSNVPAGKYRLMLEVAEAIPPQSAILQTDLELISETAAE